MTTINQFWLINIFVGAIFCGLLAAVVLSLFNKSGFGFVLGFFLGPIGVFCSWVVRDSLKHKVIKDLLIATNAAQHKTGQEIINVLKNLDAYADRTEFVKKVTGSSMEATVQNILTSSSTEATMQEIQCRCGAKLSVRRSLSGKTVKCPKCGHPYNVP